SSPHPCLTEILLDEHERGREEIVNRTLDTLIDREHVIERREMKKEEKQSHVPVPRLGKGDRLDETRANERGELSARYLHKHPVSITRKTRIGRYDCNAGTGKFSSGSRGQDGDGKEIAEGGEHGEVGSKGEHHARLT
ncbi:uncharacterized protein LACBIDRAFT_336090, partial [Laccaria bicolor S238N-H82]